MDVWDEPELVVCPMMTAETSIKMVIAPDDSKVAVTDCCGSSLLSLIGEAFCGSEAFASVGPDFW
jgi:hypothetical protein